MKNGLIIGICCFSISLGAQNPKKIVVRKQNEKGSSYVRQKPCNCEFYIPKDVGIIIDKKVRAQYLKLYRNNGTGKEIHHKILYATYKTFTVQTFYKDSVKSETITLAAKGPFYSQLNILKDSIILFNKPDLKSLKKHVLKNYSDYTNIQVSIDMCSGDWVLIRFVSMNKTYRGWTEKKNLLLD